MIDFTNMPRLHKDYGGTEKKFLQFVLAERYEKIIQPAYKTLQEQ
jgi:hypothetical protein